MRPFMKFQARLYEYGDRFKPSARHLRLLLSPRTRPRLFVAITSGHSHRAGRIAVNPLPPRAACGSPCRSPSVSSRGEDGRVSWLKPTAARFGMCPKVTTFPAMDSDSLLMIVNRTMMRIARRCRREHRYHRSPAERRDLRAYMLKSARRWRILAKKDPGPSPT